MQEKKLRKEETELNNDKNKSKNTKQTNASKQASKQTNKQINKQTIQANTQTITVITNEYVYEQKKTELNSMQEEPKENGNKVKQGYHKQTQYQK